MLFLLSNKNDTKGRPPVSFFIAFWPFKKAIQLYPSLIHA